MADEDEGYVNAVAEKLKAGLEIKDRRWRLRTYKQVFLGTDAVHFFLSNNYAANVTDAVLLGSELMAQGVFQHCMRDHPFKNEPLFYRFVDHDTFHGGSGTTDNGTASSWSDLLHPQQPVLGHQLSLQPSLPAEFTLQYDQGKKACVVSPLDGHNLKLLDNVHPAQWTNPTPTEKYQLVVIGAGAGGLVAAAGAAGVGARVAIIEEHLMGGDCLNVGCVPSKALIRCAKAAHEARTAARFGVMIGDVKVDFGKVMQRMRELRARMSANDSAKRFAGMGVDVYQGHAAFTGKHKVQVGDQTLGFTKCIIASGGTARIPSIPGLKVVPYLTNATLFNLTQLPPRFGVIGAGPLGLEIAQCMARFGSSVTVFAKSNEILGKEDREAAAIVRKQLEADGVTFLLDVQYHLISNGGPEGHEIHIQLQKVGKRETVIVDAVLVAAGRSPNVTGLGLEAAGVLYDHTDGVKVSDQLQTSNSSIYAVGDCCTSFKYTHVADAMARMAVRNALFLGKSRMSALLVPWTTFTQPEVAHVGLYGSDLEAQNIKYDTFMLPLKEVDRAILDGETEGFVKILCKAGTDSILGATIVAADAGNMISEVSLAIETNTGLAALSTIVHPYPTQADAIRRCGDLYNRTRLSPAVKTMLRKVLAVL